jgi:hypothetical protein
MEKTNETLEISKPIKNYENDYMITSYGRVFSIKNNKYLKISGKTVELYKNRICEKKNICKLIAENFMKYDETGEILHIDHNPKNIKLSNLKWKRELTINKYFIYYNTIDDTFKGITSDDPTEIITFNLLPKDKYCCFHITKEYNDNKIITNECIHRYYTDFTNSANELKSKDNKILKDLDYTLYKSHYSAIEANFKRLCKTKYEDHEDINIVEYRWIENCYNGAQCFIIPGKYICYGYDYKSNYGRALASDDFIISKKAGKEEILHEITKDIKLGYYHVKITSDHKDVQKVFSFSKHDVYASISLQFAMKYKHEFNFKFELIKDDKPNAYIYDEKDYVKGSYIFSKWFTTLSKLRANYPKNILIKMLISQLWGNLCQTNTLYTTEKHIDAEEYKKFIIYEEHLYHDGNIKYEMLDTTKCYRYNLRIKALLTAYCRNKIASKAIESNDMENIVRIHTDNITFKNIKHDELIKDDFLSEFKTTGILEWTKINRPPIRHDNL